MKAKSDFGCLYIMVFLAMVGACSVNEKLSDDSGERIQRIEEKVDLLIERNNCK